MYRDRQLLIGGNRLAELEVAYLRERTAATGSACRQLLGDLHQACTGHNRVSREVSGKNRVRSIDANGINRLAISH